VTDHAAARPNLSDEQDVDVFFYVIVPFTTVDAAEWAAGHIGCNFDCHVISAAAVDQDAPLLFSLVGDPDA
jgi:hypothetical protein